MEVIENLNPILLIYNPNLSYPPCFIFINDFRARIIYFKDFRFVTEAETIWVLKCCNEEWHFNYFVLLIAMHQTSY